MAEPKHSREWESVDQVESAEHLVRYLDSVTALDAVQVYKQKTYLHLDPKEGHRILDVGCGAGDDVRALAGIVGNAGQVIGIDSSSKMVNVAKGKPENSSLNVAFQQGSAYALDFGDNLFDSSRSDRVFQHLSTRKQALAEMARVTKSGGRICVCDTDWGTLAVDMPDRVVTNKIVHHICNLHYNGWSGRELLRLCHEAGLVDLRVEITSALFTDFGVADQLLYLQDGVRDLQETGGLSADEAAHWIGYLQEADREGVFLSAISGFIVSGRKP